MNVLIIRRARANWLAIASAPAGHACMSRCRRVIVNETELAADTDAPASVLAPEASVGFKVYDYTRSLTSTHDRGHRDRCHRILTNALFVFSTYEDTPF